MSHVASVSVADSLALQDRRDASDVLFDSTLVLSDTELENKEGEYLDWMNLNNDFADFLNTETNEEIPLSPSTSHTAPSTNKTFHMQQALPTIDILIPPTPSGLIRSLEPLLRMKTGQQRIAKLILHNLKSYPLMMMRHETLRPFIHRHLSTSEPLSNCLSLVHMISGGFQSGRKLFWKNVELECERLVAEHLKLNKWELLAAMQALLIYILTRLDEGQTDHNNYDSLLLAALMVIAKHLCYTDIKDGIHSISVSHGLEKDWVEWIYLESRRRFVFHHYYQHMTTQIPTKAKRLALPLAHLPAKKQLWEASDALTWKAEIDKNSGTQTAFGLAANGELVTLDEDQPCDSNGLLSYKPLDAKASSSSGVSNWEEWCAGMDGMGGLVMLTASLIV
ncbi:hypothetical protein N7495_008286 [Penicillium taxi]|uniref:uncharacterized protein n=1 Tax=Penicillium taxi TaxID=168475 RepID=UPI0025457277|nr:uncharacterized protein N7495_008286 [Penicillium taxi]KAJ5888245.1 hypothetical protein N7495_008286 [Penicillium taxi]